MANVTHVPYLIEAAETAAALRTFTTDDRTTKTEEVEGDKHPSACFVPIGICVCDVNIEPFLAAELLVDHVLPFMCCGGGHSAESGGNSSRSCRCSNSCSFDNNTYGDMCSSGCSECSTSDSSGYVVLTLKLPRNPSARRIATSFRIACNILSQHENNTSTRGRQRLLNKQHPYPSPPSEHTRGKGHAAGGETETGRAWARARAAPCWDFKMVHLNANSKNERTLVCRIGGRGKK